MDYIQSTSIMGQQRSLPLLKEASRDLTPERKADLKLWHVPDLSRNSLLLSEAPGIVGVSAVLRSVDDQSSSRLRKLMPNES